MRPPLHPSFVSRYNEIFFMIDTCQANTMYSKFYSPGILATGSSDKDENSYSVSQCSSPGGGSAQLELMAFDPIPT